MNTNLTSNLAIDEYGNDLIIDLSVIKNLLIAGKAGSGKSTLLHKILCNLITNNSPETLKLILIDQKRIELNVYNKLPHLLTPVITESKKAILALKWSIKEMDRRYDLLKDESCKDIESYHKDILAPAVKKLDVEERCELEAAGKIPETLPYIVIVIDEFSDLMLEYPKETEPLVPKIAQMGHVVGVHIVFATSQSGTKVLTKSIRDAIGARIALQTFSTQDSKAVIGTSDACLLRGVGDMLYRDGMKYIIRGQTNPNDYEKIKDICKSIIESYKESDFVELPITEPQPERSSIFDAVNNTDEFGDDDDDLYEQAREEIIHAGKASTSYLQRKLRIGYARAARLIDMLEERGVIGPADGSRPHDVVPEENK